MYEIVVSVDFEDENGVHSGRTFDIKCNDADEGLDMVNEQIDSWKKMHNLKVIQTDVNCNFRSLGRWQ